MATDTLPSRAEAEAALFDGPVCFAPIRHHSPACAWAVRALIRAQKPDTVLIEAPSDLAHHIALFAEPDLTLPVALAALGPAGEERARAISYYPLSEHAPEWIACAEARALGAEVRFIDMPVGQRLRNASPPPNLQPETAFDSADFIRATCARLHLRDGAELWDHLFEARLGHPDWRGFLADVYVYCAALRASTAAEVMETDESLAREAEMRRHLAEVTGTAVVVTGGFHTPALIEGGPMADAKPSAPCESYLIGYGEDALDALSGYGAGLRYPGWYARAWAAALAADGPPDWRALALDTTAGFAGAMADEDRRVPLPQLSEMAGLAEGLARMRGREAILLHDLFDAMRTALIKGEAGLGEPFTARMHAHLRGTALGSAPRAAGLPPIVADARDRAARCRIDLTSSERRPKKLDIRRKDSHRATSQFLHQMSLLNTGLGEVESGPDFLTGHRVDLLFEEWLVGWSPLVEGRLIEAAALGATIPRAASASLRDRIDAARAAGKGAALDPWLTLILTGLRAGLGPSLPPLVTEFSEAITRSADLSGLAQVILRLSSAARPGDPLHDPSGPDLHQLATRAFERMLDLLPDLTEAPDDAMPAQVDALRVVAGVLRAPEGERYDRERFDRALAALLDSPACPPLLASAVLGLLVSAGLRPIGDLARLLSGTMRGIGLPPEDRVAALRGVLLTAPALLWQHPPVLEATNDALSALDDPGFVALLPDLRHALTTLNPHETDRLAEEVSALLDTSAGALTAATRFSQTDLARALRLDAEIDLILTADFAPAGDTA